MGTKVVASKALPQTVFVYDEEPSAQIATAHFCNSDFMVIDGIEWDGIAQARAGLIRQHRGFGSIFHPSGAEEPSGVAEGINLMLAQMDALASRLFLEPRGEKHSSFRPMVTGPEPMHFDVYPAPLPILTCFVNIALTRRIYRVGPTFHRLIETQPKVMRQVASQCDEHGMSYRIRDLTMAGQPPMPKNGDAQLVELEPGAIWFFNGKTVSHEVVFGEGALAASWELPESRAHSQQGLMQDARSKE